MQNTKCFIIAAICFSILGLFGKTLKAERFTRSGSGTYDDPYKILFMYDSDDGSGIFSVRGQTVVDTSVGAGVFHREFKQKCEYHDLVPWGTDPNATILEKNYSGWDVTETEDAVVNSVGIKTLFNYVQVNQTVVNISGGLGVRDEEDQLRTGLVITSTI